VLNPGDTSTSLTGTYSTAGETPVIAPFVTTFSGTKHGLVFDFSLTTNVYHNPVTGGDDFVYQLTNTGPNNASTDTFDRLTLSSFLGFSVDADYQANTGSINSIPGDVAPNEVDRSSDGSVVGYSFNNDPIGPMSNTDLLVVRTNSSSFHMGSATVIDNDQGSVITQVPFGTTVNNNVPEPTSIGLIAASLGLMAARRRRS
jgi:hypothetical protein